VSLQILSNGRQRAIHAIVDCLCVWPPDYASDSFRRQLVDYKELNRKPLIWLKSLERRGELRSRFGRMERILAAGFGFFKHHWRSRQIVSDCLPARTFQCLVRLGNCAKERIEREPSVDTLMDQLVRLNMRSPFTEDMLENVSLKIRQAWWWGDAPPSVLLAHPIDSAVMNHGNKPGRESRAACFDVTLKQRHVVGRKRRANFRE
jgi:hypothetical protein